MNKYILNRDSIPTNRIDASERKMAVWLSLYEKLYIIGNFFSLKIVVALLSLINSKLIYMIYLHFFQFLNNGILNLTFSNGTTKHVLLTEDSGKIVTRKKTNTISSVDHPGIYIGRDYYSNEVYILHNHYKIFKTAGISPFQEYADGAKVSWDNRTCVNSKDAVLIKGLEQAILREPYKLGSYNCQVTVNSACNNKRTSEDVKKWGGRIAVGAFFALCIGAITR